MVVGLVFTAVALPNAFARSRVPASEIAAAERSAVAEQSAAAASAAAEEERRTRITVPPEPHLLILGDSYTEGYGAEDPEEQGWAYLATDQLGWDVQVDGVGGTGFTYDGPNGLPQSYDDRIAALIADGSFAPNVVVLQGGQNDYRAAPAELRAAVVAEVEQLRAAFNGVQIVIFGPAAPQPLGDQLRSQDDAIRAGADQAAVPYISPVSEGWLTTENSGEYGFSDGAHLNTAGHAYLAQRFLEDFRTIAGLS